MSAQNKSKLYFLEAAFQIYNVKTHPAIKTHPICID